MQLQTKHGIPRMGEAQEESLKDKASRRPPDKGPRGQRRKHFVNSAYYISAGSDKNCQYYVEQERLLRGALI